MKTKVGLIILAMALSGTVFASSEVMQSLDADESGTISKEEASANEVVMEIFDEIDTNGDGELDTVEFAQFEEMPQQGGGAIEE